MKTLQLNEINLQEQKPFHCVRTDSNKLNTLLGGGLRTDNLIVIQGPSGCGKTTFLQRLALNCIDAGEKVLYISAGEQDPTELTERFCCMVSGVEYDKFVSNRENEDLQKVLKAQLDIGDKITIVYTENPQAVIKGTECTEMEWCLEFAKTYEIKYIIFDYLGSVISETADSQYALLTHIAGRLKNYATDNHSCIITAMQTNRALKEYLKSRNVDYSMIDEYFMGDSVGPAKKASICMSICNDKDMPGVKHINVFKNRLNGSLEDVCVYVERTTYKWKDTELKNNGEINSINGKELFRFN